MKTIKDIFAMITGFIMILVIFMPPLIYFIVCLTILYQNFGVLGFLLGFFIPPLALFATPFYTIVVYDNWNLLIILGVYFLIAIIFQMIREQ